MTTTGTQKNGFAGALWNIKVFGAYETASPQLWMGLSGLDWNGTEWKNDGGMLGGIFRLKTGQVSRKRIAGQEAIVLAPGTQLEFESPVINPKEEHTATVWVYENNRWTSKSAEDYVQRGKVVIQASGQELAVTNFRYYNWKQEEAEKAYDATVGLVRVEASDCVKKGLLVSMTAEDFAVGDTVPYIPNKGVVEGYFEA